MNIKHTNSIPGKEGTVFRSVALSKPGELIILFSTGQLIRYTIGEGTSQYLFSAANNGINYTDGGFDLEAVSSIYTMGDIVVVTNDFKTHGYAHVPGHHKAIHLWREDYHAGISRFPLALYKDAQDVPHLIYSSAWNHVQIMNLHTLQVLTADKSLIKVRAEEEYLDFTARFGGGQFSHPWPSRYDYFYGGLQVAPDHRHFLSTGWSWGSSDDYRVYNIDHFISSNRIADILLRSWEHENRAACWIDAHTIAVAYNPFMEGDDEAVTKETPDEIHLYEIKDDQSEVVRTIVVKDIKIVSAKFHYSKQLDAIVLFSDHIGIAVISLSGEQLYHNQAIQVNDFYPDHNLLLKYEDHMIHLYQLTI